MKLRINGREEIILTGGKKGFNHSGDREMPAANQAAAVNEADDHATEAAAEQTAVVAEARGATDGRQRSDALHKDIPLAKRRERGDRESLLHDELSAKLDDVLARLEKVAQRYQLAAAAEDAGKEQLFRQLNRLLEIAGNTAQLQAALHEKLQSILAAVTAMRQEWLEAVDGADSSGRHPAAAELASRIREALSGMEPG